jgi:hypothetical protein
MGDFYRPNYDASPPRQQNYNMRDLVDLDTIHRSRVDNERKTKSHRSSDGVGNSPGRSNHHLHQHQHPSDPNPRLGSRSTQNPNWKQEQARLKDAYLDDFCSRIAATQRASRPSTVTLLKDYYVRHRMSYP